MRRVGVRDYHLHPGYRARRRVGNPLSYRDGARGSGRRQLHEADFIADPMVMVDVEANLFGVECLCAIDIGYGDHHQFDFPVHRVS